MKKHFRYGLFFALGAMLALGFVACGDESSSGPSKNEETGIETEVSSSSVDEVLSSSVHIEESSSSFESEGLSSSVESGASSSSENSTESSSGKNTEPAEVSSCSVAEGLSSSTTVEPSSSSVKAEQSSSSEKVAEPSSSSKVQESSSSVKVEESSSSAKTDVSSSSEKPAESSSSEQVEESSSSEKSSSSAGIPSKLYDCEIYKCVTTKYLNPDIEYGEYLDVRDSLVYRTVQIGNQVWLAQNLNHETKDSYCYGDKVNNCLLYGRLYDWESARSICPDGWHLPDTLDFGILRDYAIENNGGIGVGTSLMCGKSDKFGFCSLAHGGYKPGKDGIYGDNKADFYWTSVETADNQKYAQLRGFRKEESYMIYNSYKKTWLLSVRCIKD